jgi:hypothetical protein
MTRTRCEIAGLARVVAGQNGEMAGNPIVRYLRWQQREDEQQRQASAAYKQNRVRQAGQLSDLI